MAETKHTPGPWTASADRRGIWEIIHEGDMLAQVWRVRTGVDGDLPAEANAALIAAAPDLYEACRKANTCASLPDAVKELVRAAIALAEGRTPPGA